MRLHPVDLAGVLGFLFLALVVLTALAGCGDARPETPAVPAVPAVSTTGAPTEPPAAGPLADERARLKGELAQVEAKIAAEATAKAEAPLRALLVWSLWAGGALAILGTIALGLTFSPWGAWIPGGKGTAVAAVATGGAVVVLSRALIVAIGLAWLPWLVLGLGALAGLAYVAILAIRATARHADRMEKAETDDDVVSSKLASIRDQAASGLHSLIKVARKGIT